MSSKITIVLQKKGYYDDQGLLVLSDKVETLLFALKQENKRDSVFQELYDPDNPYKYTTHIEWDLAFRCDPDLIQLADSLTDENGNNEHFQLVQIPTEYKDCFTIKTNYDGEERVVCDPDKLILHTLKNLDLSTLPDQDRLRMLERLVTLAKAKK
ncbi:MAG: hypothetical protein WD512_10775 [Candidatus Paceibacterota bacterium]